MNRTLLLAFVVLGVMAGCKPKTYEQEMKATADNVIEALKTGSERKFKGLLGVELSNMSKDEEMVSRDFKRCKSYYDRHLAAIVVS